MSHLRFFRQKHPGPSWGLELKRGLGCTYVINHLYVETKAMGLAGVTRGTMESEKRRGPRTFLEVTTDISGTCVWACML